MIGDEANYGGSSYPGSGQPSQPQGKVSNKPALLDAWSDPVAGVAAYTPCVHTCNLFGDGDWRLVVGDEGRKLKVRESLPVFFKQPKQE
eukprot:1148886-Pelagomonas_calceolata.AAC.3